MVLSKRMKAVADLVRPVRCAADIGCDHAYVSIYLAQNGIAEHMIAMDVNRGPLEIARHNIREYGLQEKIEVRLSDGASALRPGEADTLVIAGMGGELMERILRESAGVAASCGQLVLQPQSEQGRLRKYVEEAGFEIRQERMVQEDGKYYVMFSCFPSGNREKTWNDPVLYRYGKHLLEERNPVMKEFLEQQTDKYEKILAGLEEKSPDSEERIGYLKQEVLYMKEALTYYEM